MRTTTSKLAVLFLGATALGGAISAPAIADETVKLTILGVGDIYSFTGGETRGGFARLNAVAKAEKAANPNTIYVFDGDMLSPSLLSGLDKGENTIQLTNVVPFDIAVPGNHEFDFGTDNFIEKAGQSKYPWAAVNIADGSGNRIDVIGGTMMKEVGGLNIALVPVAEDDTPEVASTGDWQFADTVKSAIDAGNAARNQGADLVIGVIQGNHTDDREIMASHVFDVIMSGDDHDYMTAYDGVTAYVETSTDANFLSPLYLTVDIKEEDGKREISWTPSFKFIDTASVEPDPETQKIVEELKGKLDASLNVEIGTTASELDSRRNIVRSQESAIGDLIADAMKAANGADIAITNGGGIRGDRTYDAGTTLTRRDILTELPFGNVTVVTELTGQDILDALENGFSQVEDGAGRFPQVSDGMKIVVDLKKPAGQRVVSVEIDGQPLDPAAKYKVATNDYMLGGGDGYTALGNGTVLIEPKEGNLMASDVINYIEQAGSVSAGIEGRIVEQ